jgi:hypothetical protein
MPLEKDFTIFAALAPRGHTDNFRRESGGMFVPTIELASGERSCKRTSGTNPGISLTQTRSSYPLLPFSDIVSCASASALALVTHDAGCKAAPSHQLERRS